MKTTTIFKALATITCIVTLINIAKTLIDIAKTLCNINTAGINIYYRQGRKSEFSSRQY